tara:strand:+ start:219 stop:539 length:321 start_codon:yes stop_codon:yes gene_type:complete
MSRYTKIPIFRSSVEYKTAPNKRYYGTVRYPEIPLNFEDIYVYTEQGDRFDILAQEYYGDPRLWWVISSANNSLNQGSYYAEPGVQIRIPSQIGTIISQYNELNDY